MVFFENAIITGRWSEWDSHTGSEALSVVVANIVTLSNLFFDDLPVIIKLFGIVHHPNLLRLAKTRQGRLKAREGTDDANPIPKNSLRHGFF